MRVSTLGRYALRAMIDLTEHQDQEPVSRSEIGVRQAISGDYLAHLLARLRRAGLIRSIKGPGGGYVLARRPAEISTGDVLRAVEECLDPVSCVGNSSAAACLRMETCVAHQVWEHLGRRIYEFLDSVTLADLCEQAQRLASQRRGGSA